MTIDKQALRISELEELNELLREKVKKLESDLWDKEQLRQVYSEKSFNLDSKVRELEARNQKDFVWRGREISRLNDEVDELKEKLEAAEKRIAELDTAKNGYILLVQDAKPNFDVNGNSPVIPGGWISCSERMPDNDESKPIAIFTGKCLGQGMLVATYDDDGFFDYWEGMEIIGVTHWMPLPASPQQ
ncbi:DUF551 domain-containing protein [Salmonella enterica]|uniref:DUF551 domain-containing protein n=1 Tax=Salmonella enterica TaxID=28901 RepID=UPI0009A98F3A|nr:DUF551 domain-containing protein [Salmonella enterica]